MMRKVFCNFFIFLLSVYTVVAHAQEEFQEAQNKIEAACPKAWEDLFSEFRLKHRVLDIWEGDLVDKARFVEYADTFLINEQGESLLDSYSDIATILTECSAQRIKYYKMLREYTNVSVSNLMTQLDSYTMFKRSAVATGILYENQMEGQLPSLEAIINLAVGRFTTQSGTSNDDPDVEQADVEQADAAEHQGYATRAVDVNTDGSFANGSVTHTGIQDQPYWQVDLDEVAELTEIRIHNRTDCCSERLSNFFVVISNEPIYERDLEQARILEHTSEYYVANITGTSHTVTLPEGTTGRFVRIQLADVDTALSLAEVQVFGKPLKDL